MSERRALYSLAVTHPSRDVRTTTANPAFNRIMPKASFGLMRISVSQPDHEAIIPANTAPVIRLHPPENALTGYRLLGYSAAYPDDV
jgi:hypothetical protein